VPAGQVGFASRAIPAEGHPNFGKPCPFSPGEKGFQERPLWSEIMKHPSWAGDMEDRIAKIYTELARRSESQKEFNTGLLMQTWMHAQACGINNVHDDCRFLPWHRGFLYFHERIIRKTIPGQQDFRLPVWDWDIRREIPRAYLKWGASPLAVLAQKRLQIPIVTTGPGDVTSWLQSDFNAFLGGPKGSKQPPGAFGGPHSTVHALVGSLFSVPAHAAADPLFYSHHANVDRLWKKWAAQTEQPAGQKDWCDNQFTYFDERGKAVSVTIGQLLDESNWGYRYPKESNLPPKHKVESISGVTNTPNVYSFSVEALTHAVFTATRAAAREMLRVFQSFSDASQLSFQLRVDSPPSGYYQLAVNVGGVRFPLGGFGVFVDAAHQHGPLPISVPLSLSTLSNLLNPRLSRLDESLSVTFSYRDYRDTDPNHWKTLSIAPVANAVTINFSVSI
jgi:hypothetical protein